MPTGVVIRETWSHGQTPADIAGLHTIEEPKEHISHLYWHLPRFVKSWLPTPIWRTPSSQRSTVHLLMLTMSVLYTVILRCMGRSCNRHIKHSGPDSKPVSRPDTVSFVITSHSLNNVAQYTRSCTRKCPTGHLYGETAGGNNMFGDLFNLPDSKVFTVVFLHCNKSDSTGACWSCRIRSLT